MYNIITFDKPLLAYGHICLFRIPHVYNRFQYCNLLLPKHSRFILNIPVIFKIFIDGNDYFDVGWKLNYVISSIILLMRCIIFIVIILLARLQIIGSSDALSTYLVLIILSSITGVPFFFMTRRSLILMSIHPEIQSGLNFAQFQVLPITAQATLAPVSAIAEVDVNPWQRTGGLNNVSHSGGVSSNWNHNEPAVFIDQSYVHIVNEDNYPKVNESIPVSYSNVEGTGKDFFCYFMFSSSILCINKLDDRNIGAS